jgi:hypothetical protein
MNMKFSLLYFVCFLFILTSAHGQNTEKTLLVSKISKPERVRRITHGTRLKIQTQSGDFIRTRYHSFGNDYLLTQQSDTIYFKDIYSFRAQRKINKAEFLVGVPLLVAGVAGTVAGLPLSVMLIFMQETGPAIFLVPLGGVVSTVAGIKTVGRKTYRTKKWKIFSEEI